jgi:hypothetical protein
MSFIHWLEEDNKRLRKVLALFTAFVWLIATIASYAMLMYGYDTLAVYSLVTAQFAVVITGYFATKAETD